MSEEPDTDANTKQLPAPAHSVQEPGTTYIQGYLIAPPRSEMPHLSDDEYEKIKAGAGEVGTEHDETYKKAAVDSETLRMQLGMTAAGKTVSVRLLPESITRGDVDVRGTPIWSQLSEIHYLYRDLDRASAATAQDAAFFRILDPIMQGGESNPNAIGEAFIGRAKSKGRPERVTAFSGAMQIVQHGSEEDRQAIIDDMKRRVAIARGEPDPVAIAKQLVLDGMPLKPGEEYGGEESGLKAPEAARNLLTAKRRPNQLGGGAPNHPA